MVASKMVPPRGGKQAVRHFGAFREPVYEHGPKLRDRNIGDGVRCKGVDPVWEITLPHDLARSVAEERRPMRHKRLAEVEQFPVWNVSSRMQPGSI